MLDIRKAQQRGHANYGWLEAKHTFSFGSYHDPQEMGFSDLLVINDDRVQAGQGFGTHGHRDMEIFTYVLDGAVAHKDSMGNGSQIVPGDVQMMSAGSGIQHSEFNPSDKNLLRLLQIWIVPNQKGVVPRYQQAHFTDREKRGQFRLIISPEGNEGSLSVYQDVKVYAGLFDGQETAQLHLDPNRYAYIHVAKGSIVVNGILMEEGDGARVRDERLLTFQSGQHAEVLVFDLRAQELPKML